MSPPVLPQDTPCEGQDAADWAVAILNEAGWPVTEDNVYTFAGWFRNEGGGGQNNPMNSTEGSEYPAINSDGVRNYPTPEVGVAETVVTLENGYYPAICAAFKAGTGLGSPSAEAAAELGTWSGGGYHSITLVEVPMPAPPKPKPTKPSGVVHFKGTYDIGTDRWSVKKTKGTAVYAGSALTMEATLKVQVGATADGPRVNIFREN